MECGLERDVDKQEQLCFVGVIDDDVAAEAPTRGPATLASRTTRLYDSEKVVHDSVCHRFVEYPFVAEPLEVHFQAL
jgi:hypothetical protein